MRLAVTGATGLVGRAVLRECARRGHEVIALVRDIDHPALREGKEVTSRLWHLEDAGKLELPDGADSLMHLAAFIPPRLDVPSFAELCLRLNAVAAGVLVEAAARLGVPHLILASTGSLYVNRGRPAAESDPVYPAARAPYYLASKLAGEVFASAAARRADVALAILRIASVYGPGIRAESVVARFLNQAAKGEAHELTRPEHTADFVFVDDVARALVTSAERRTTGIMNVGSGQLTSVAELSRAVLHVFHCATDQRMSDLGASRDLAGFPALDVAHARGELGFVPTPLEEGLRLTAQAMALL